MNKKIIDSQYPIDKLLNFDDKKQKIMKNQPDQKVDSKIINKTPLIEKYEELVSLNRIIAFKSNQKQLTGKKQKIQSFVQLIAKFIAFQKVLTEILRFVGQFFIKKNADEALKNELLFQKDNLREFHDYSSYLQIYKDSSNDIHRLIYLFKKFINFFKLTYITLEENFPSLSQEKNLNYIFTLFQNCRLCSYKLNKLLYRFDLFINN